MDEIIKKLKNYNPKGIFEHYFNVFLKSQLNYPETFEVEYNTNKNMIILTSNIKSGLIERLRIDDALLNEINSQLLSILQEINFHIDLVNLTLLDNTTIIIKYEVTFGELSEISVAANIASNLTIGEIEGLCQYNPQFINTCNQSRFWIELFKKKFGRIPDVISRDRNINYKKLYIDVLKYEEFDKIIRGKEKEVRVKIKSG